MVCNGFSWYVFGGELREFLRFFSLSNDEYNIILSSLFSYLFGCLLYLLTHCERLEMLRVFLGLFWIFSLLPVSMLYCHYCCPLFRSLLDFKGCCSLLDGSSFVFGCLSLHWSLWPSLR